MLCNDHLWILAYRTINQFLSINWRNKKHFHFRQHEYSHTGETPFECKIPGDSIDLTKNIFIFFLQIVTRSSHQSSSWKGTFWSTARQKLFSVMSVIERFDARIIWGITRKFMTPGRPSTLAPMTHVPAPTTQWPVSENIRLVGSEKLGHKMLAFLLLVSDVTHSRVAKKSHIKYSSSRSFDVLGYKHKHWFPPGDALCRGGPAWLQNLQNDAFKPGIL